MLKILLGGVKKVLHNGVCTSSYRGARFSRDYQRSVLAARKLTAERTLIRVHVITNYTLKLCTAVFVVATYVGPCRTLAKVCFHPVV
jgi:hypothetical protein